MLIVGLALAATITISNSGTTVTHVSSSVSGGSSASASSHVVTDGTSSVVDVYTNVNGVEQHEHREFGGGGTVEVHAVATTSGAAGGTVIGTSTGSGMGSTTVREQKTVERVLALVRSILALFGLSVTDL